MSVLACGPQQHVNIRRLTGSWSKYTCYNFVAHNSTFKTDLQYISKLYIECVLSSSESRIFKIHNLYEIAHINLHVKSYCSDIHRLDAR